MIATTLSAVKWSKINSRVDEYTTNGKTKRTYQIYQDKTGADAESLKASIQAAFDEFKASPEMKSKTFDARYPASLGWTEKDGVTTFKFWTLSEYPATNDKPATPKTIPVSVLNKGVLGLDKSIGNGSTAQIAYTMRPYWSSAKGFGVSLMLEKVLVHNLVEFGGSSDDLSVFGVKDVFSDATSSMVTPTVDVSSEEIPF